MTANLGVILVAAALVIAAGTFRGGRLIRGDPAPATRPQDDAALNPDQKWQLVLDGISDPSRIGALCELNHVSEAEFYAWSATAFAGATDALVNSGSEHAGNGATPLAGGASGRPDAAHTQLVKWLAVPVALARTSAAVVGYASHTRN